MPERLHASSALRPNFRLSLRSQHGRSARLLNTSRLTAAVETRWIFISRIISVVLRLMVPLGNRS